MLTPVSDLARGMCNINYGLSGEVRRKLSALPSSGEGIYSPELVHNSDELTQRAMDHE